jgi:AAA-like domain/TIR domain
MTTQSNYVYDIFISYSQSDQDWVLNELLPQLERSGLKVIIDSRDFAIGVARFINIEKAIQESRQTLLVITQNWIASEGSIFESLMIQTKDPIGYSRRMLPVVLEPCTLPQRIEMLTYADLTDPFTQRRKLTHLISQIIEGSTDLASNTPFSINSENTPYNDSDFLETLDVPGGALRPDSELYIERRADNLLRRQLYHVTGTTTVILSPLEMGKSSILAKCIDIAKKRGYRIVDVDFQLMDDGYLQNWSVFLRYFIIIIGTKLGLKQEILQILGDDAIISPEMLNELMTKYFLPISNQKLVLAIDETNRLLKAEFRDSFFYLLRSWHNNRAKIDVWKKLDIVLVMSTETYVYVGVAKLLSSIALNIRLKDFDQNQVSELSNRYRVHLSNRDIRKLMQLLSGHPSLTNRALYTMVSENMNLRKLSQIAITEDSPFFDHLEDRWSLLYDQPKLKYALTQIILHGNCTDEDSYYRLLGTGLIKGLNNKCTCRCKLYEDYLKERLEIRALSSSQVSTVQ